MTSKNVEKYAYYFSNLPRLVQAKELRLTDFVLILVCIGESSDVSLDTTTFGHSVGDRSAAIISLPVDSLRRGSRWDPLQSQGATTSVPNISINRSGTSAFRGSQNFGGTSTCITGLPEFRAPPPPLPIYPSPPSYYRRSRPFDGNK